MRNAKEFFWNPMILSALRILRQEVKESKLAMPNLLSDHHSRKNGATPHASIRHHFLSESEQFEMSRTLSLSGREAQIALLLCSCRSESQIAILLGISPHTVHTYLERTFRKAGVRSRCELVAKMFQIYVTKQNVLRERLSRKERPSAADWTIHQQSAMSCGPVAQSKSAAQRLFVLWHPYCVADTALPNRIYCVDYGGVA